MSTKRAIKNIYMIENDEWEQLGDRGWLQVFTQKALSKDEYSYDKKTR